MSAIITGVLKLTIGVLWDKARDTAATRLQDGDLTDEQCRQLVVRELDDIKTKFDGLARKDLLASVSFLGEGVCLLNMSVDQSNDNDNGQTTSQALRAEALTNNPSSLALSQAIACLKIVSQERFLSAKACFKAAREEATRAFSNEALSVEDRILATKLRVMSRLFESLEDPEAAASSCKLYLEALHKVRVVQQTFSVHVNKGIRARFNKTKRLENVKSVCMINVVLFDFIRKFTTFPQGLFSWLRIETVKRAKRPCHPILVYSEIAVDATVPYEITLNDKDDFWCWGSAVNSKGEIITTSRRNSGILKVIKRTGEIKTVCSLPEKDTRVNGFEILLLAIDVDDSVYVLTCFQEPDGHHSRKLFVYDNKFEIKKQVSLDFLRKEIPTITGTAIAVSKDKKIFIFERACGGRVYFCDSDGTLLYSFSVEERDVLIPSLGVSDKNEVIVACWHHWYNGIYIYTEEGELKQIIRLPKDDRPSGVAFHHVTKTVIVYTYHQVKKSCHLFSYSGTGDLQASLPAPNTSKLISHQSGQVALFHQKGVIFI